MRYLWLLVSVGVIWGLFSLGYDVGYQYGYQSCEAKC